MPTNDDIRAAAERDCDIAISRLAAWIRDFGAEKAPAFIADLSIVLLLAKEHVTEHPADDREPVTEEWLLERGFASPGRYGSPSLSLNGLSVWKGNRDGDWQFRYGGAVLNRLRSFETRGDVRLLSRALGIELTE